MNRLKRINIESFDYPVLVTDETLFITEKNIAAGEYKVKFRLGASLKNYLSSYDVRRIEKLDQGDILFLTAIECFEDFFIVCRFDDRYYLFHTTMINILNKKLESFCDETNLVKKYFNYIFENAEDNNDTETKLRKMRFASKLKRHYAIYNELFYGDVTLPIGEDDIMGAITCAIKKMESMLNKEHRVLFFDNRVTSTLCACFSISDIALVLSGLIVIACTMKEKGNVCCSADYFGDELIFSVGFIGGECDVYDKLLYSFDESLSENCSIELFELLLLKRICDYNGWKLKYSLFSDKTNQVIKLFIPCKETTLLKMSLDNRNFEIMERLISEELSFML